MNFRFMVVLGSGVELSQDARGIVGFNDECCESDRTQEEVGMPREEVLSFFTLSSKELSRLSGEA